MPTTKLDHHDSDPTEFFTTIELGELQDPPTPNPLSNHFRLAYAAEQAKANPESARDLEAQVGGKAPPTTPGRLRRCGLNMRSSVKGRRIMAALGILIILAFLFIIPFMLHHRQESA